VLPFWRRFFDLGFGASTLDLSHIWKEVTQSDVSVITLELRSCMASLDGSGLMTISDGESGGVTTPMMAAILVELRL
jgi:hypothetical protein